MGEGIVNGQVPIKSWIYALSQGWGAVSANELLTVDSLQWGSMNLMSRKTSSGLLPPPLHHECIAFAAIERSVKYGKSIAITIPMCEHTLSRLVVYLHRLRLDAMQGGIRTPWLNSGTSFVRKDVVCIARPSVAIRALSIVPNLGAYILKNTSPIKNSLDKQQGTTALIDGAIDVMELIDIIEPRTRPLVFIIDGTRGGYEKANEIDFAFFECFPEIPRIVLLSQGDEQAADRLRKSRSSTHLWITRLSDTAAFYGNIKLPSIKLDVVSDEVASAHLTQIGHDLYTLRNLNEQVKDSILKEKLQALNKVCRAFGELSQPLEYLERLLIDRTRPGLFPVRCLDRWLEIAAKNTCKYGEQQHQVNGVIERLSALHKLLLNPTTVTGKAGYLEAKIKQAIVSGRSLSILVGTRHEADSMDIWLDTFLPNGWDETEIAIVTVFAMDGLASYRHKISFAKDVIILGMLWANRLHWLSIPCETLSIVCYTHEQQWYEKTMRQWWFTAGGLSRKEGDKLLLWTLQWSKKLTDSDTDSAIQLDMNISRFENVGRYPVEQKVLSVLIDTSVDNWLEALIKDAVGGHSSTDTMDANNEFALIRTEKCHIPLFWAVHRGILVLGEERILYKRPDELREGDKIILLKNSEERLATQESLFDLLLESEGMRQLIRIAKQWNDIIDRMNAKHKGKLSDIRKLLLREGVEISEEAIRGWVDHRVLGPQNNSVIFIFTKYLKLDNADNRAKLISNAVTKIRSLHQQLGIQLRKALIQGVSSSASIQIGDLILDRTLLDEIVEVQTVLSVVMPYEHNKHSVVIKNESLKAIVDEVETHFGERLLFTKPALKSLRDCGFMDSDIFKTCITLMATRLHEFYLTKETRMHSLIEIFNAAEIEYQPKLSAVTMGKYTDWRQYKNRPADLNRHFKLGSGRDPKHTMRIHFEWDDEDQLIIIHHAGRHLESSQS